MRVQRPTTRQYLPVQAYAAPIDDACAPMEVVRGAARVGVLEAKGDRTEGGDCRYEVTLNAVGEYGLRVGQEQALLVVDNQPWMGFGLQFGAIMGGTAVGLVLIALWMRRFRKSDG